MKKFLPLLILILALVLGYYFIDKLLFNGIKGEVVQAEGIQGKVFCSDSVQDGMAVILLGGGPWGDYWAQSFAQEAWVGLSLPYTREKGLPNLPEEIKLEYFENAIHWLSQREEVNPEKILVMGASRNAELALILASTFPDLIHGVIAYCPSAVSWSNTVLPFNSDEIKSSWTYKGEDIAFIPMPKIKAGKSKRLNTLEYWNSGLDKQNLADSAAIRVEQINGPILLFSGKDDMVWPSAKMADMIEKRVEQSQFQHRIENVQFEDAGHLISRNPDNDKDTEVRFGIMHLEGRAYEFEFGGSQEGDNQAKKEARDILMAFLKELE